MHPKTFKKHHHYFLGFLITTSILGGLASLTTHPNSQRLALANEEDGTRIIRPSDTVEHPAVAMDPTGNSIVTWQEKNDLDYDIFAVQLDPQGYPVTVPFRVNQYAVSDQKFPRIAMDGQGNFVIVWQSYGEDSSGAGVYGQRFLASGQKVGDEFRANTHVVGNQMTPDVAMNPEGYFVVTWISEYQKGYTKSVYLQRYTSEGKRLGEETRLNEKPSQIQNNPAVALTAENKALVVWQGAYKNYWNIKGRIIDIKDLNAVSKDLTMGVDDGSERTHPRVVANAQNQFFVIWKEHAAKEEYKGIIFQYDNIRGQMVTGQGTFASGAFDINKPAHPHHDLPEVAALPSGAVAVWQNADEWQDQNWSTLIQVVDAGGKPVGSILRLHGEKEQFDWMPAVAANGQGDYAVAWIHFDPVTKKTVLHYKNYPVTKESATKAPQKSAFRFDLKKLLQASLLTLTPSR